jgi:hypothetical protein
MANRSSVSDAQQKLEEAKRNLVGAVNDFSIPDERIIELLQTARLAAQETALTKKEERLL